MALPGPEAFERAGLKAWPGIEVEWDGSWVRRASGGHTQRANSTQCFDPADDDDAPRRVAAARAWYEARGLRPIFRVNLLSGTNLAAALDRAGWIEIDHSRLMAMPLGAVEADPRGEVHPVDHPDFLDAQRRLKGWDDDTLAKFRAIVGVLSVPAWGVVLRAADGRPVSSALMALADGIVITGNVVTDASERRKGHGAAMMRTGLAWAKAAGAQFAALNVGADNAAGQALYRRLGYLAQYDYVYRVPGAANE
jgi:ribosomal protein S18 acetylase RimI-like enzyme